MTAFRRIAHPYEPVGGHRVGLALQLQRFDGLRLDGTANQVERRLADQHLSGRRSLLEPRGDVDGVAGREALVRARHDLAGHDPDAALEAELGERVSHLDRRSDGAERVVLVHDRHAEHGHHGVADELLDGAAVALDDPLHALEVGARSVRSRSGSTDSPSAVEPARSQNSTVTVLRCSLAMAQCRRVPDRIDDLDRGREAYARRAWLEAHDLLARAHDERPLESPDLELLATTAFMLGRDDESSAWLERAHQRYLAGGETLRAVRCAAWIVLNLASRGEMGPASGWLGRAQRLVESESECAERGWLLLPGVFQQEAAGDFAAAAAVAEEAVRLGDRFGDRDLFALAIQAKGRMLIKSGQVREGLAFMDEGMVAVTAEELSPDRHRDRLLRRHPHVPGGLRSRPGSRVDTGARRLVGAAAGDGRVHGALLRTPGGDPAARRRMAGRARGGAACRRAVHRDEKPAPPG